MEKCFFTSKSGLHGFYRPNHRPLQSIIGLVGHKPEMIPQLCMSFYERANYHANEVFCNRQFSVACYVNKKIEVNVLFRLGLCIPLINFHTSVYQVLSKYVLLVSKQCMLKRQDGHTKKD